MVLMPPMISCLRPTADTATARKTPLCASLLPDAERGAADKRVDRRTATGALPGSDSMTSPARLVSRCSNGHGCRGRRRRGWTPTGRQCEPEPGARTGAAR